MTYEQAGHSAGGLRPERDVCIVTFIYVSVNAER